MIDLLSLPTLLATALDDTGVSWFETIQKGGIVGAIIIALSIGAFALMIMHSLQLRRAALLPATQLEQIESLLSRGEIAGAVDYCLDPEHDSYLTRILSSGLIRFQKSAFGALEIKNAIEEAGEDQTARLYRSTDALGVIGAIAPLLGLLGTVLGMIGAFESLPKAGATQHEALATNISLALVTTLMGLILAIPCISLYTFFRNRIDAFASEAGMEIERLVLLLESPPTPQRGAAPAQPTPVPRAAPATGGAGGGAGR